MSMIDAMVTLLLLGTTGVVFSTTIPFGFQTTRQAKEYKVATAVAQKKMEQMRARKYESLSQALLVSSDVIDPGSATLPYTFTNVDGVANSLPEGRGELDIQPDSATIRRVIITVRWKDSTTGRNRSVVLTTLIADKRARA
jgi:Tfp pilus assembly protein PilV